MNIAVKSALISAALAFAHACATPVEIEDELVFATPNDFDAGVLGGAGGDVGQSGASAGGAGAGLAGAASGTSGTGGISGMPVGRAGASGLPAGGASGGGAGGSSPGAAGAGAGGAASGGAAGSAAGTGGASGVAGAGGAVATGGTAGTGGTGGTGSAPVFDASACDFADLTGCDTLACETRCPTNDGGSCLNRCVAVVDCVADQVAENPAASCVTADDPLCGGRDVGQPRQCTQLVETAGGTNATGANQPSFVAREFVECICSVPRP